MESTCKTRYLQRCHYWKPQQRLKLPKLITTIQQEPILGRWVRIISYHEKQELWIDYEAYLDTLVIPLPNLERIVVHGDSGSSANINDIISSQKE